VGFHVEGTPWRSIVANTPRIPSRMMLKLETAHVVHEDPKRRCAKGQDYCETSSSIVTE
jgi:hypothetical protein